MPTELLTVYFKLPALALVAGRLAGIVMFIPMVGGFSVPAPVRVLLVVGLAALVTAVAPIPNDLPTAPSGLAWGLAGEVSIGALIGLAVRIAFVGLQLGAQLIAQEAGLAFGQIVDPTSGMETDTISVFYVQLAGVIFLIVGGHRALVSAALTTFEQVPLLSAPDLVERGTDLILAALLSGFQLALRVAAPVLLTLFLVNVALGFVARTVPQLNVATVGFSIKGLLAFGLIAVSLPSALSAFSDLVEQVVVWTAELMQ